MTPVSSGGGGKAAMIIIAALPLCDDPAS